MKCVECDRKLAHADHKKALDSLGVELCAPHRIRMEKLRKTNNTTKEAIQLYYGLKEQGVQPMLEWWNGIKHIDIALSRVRLNIHIDTDYENITHEQAMNELENTMHFFDNGFNSVRIPSFLIREHFQETIDYILRIMLELKARVKII